MPAGDQIWSALEPSLAALHPQAPTVVFQAELGPHEGGPPLSRIVAFEVERPMPHWHLVTCGLSASKFVPGYPDVGGFELSFRLARESDSSTPPAWALDLLQQLGHDAFADDEPVKPNALIDLSELEGLPLPTAMSSGVFLEDPLAPGLLQLLMLDAPLYQRIFPSENRARLAYELMPLGIVNPAARPAVEAQRLEPSTVPSAQSQLAPRVAMPEITSLLVEKKQPRLRLTVAGDEARNLAAVCRGCINNGTHTVMNNGWTITFTADEVPRSASWATALMIYLTIDLAKQVAADLENAQKHGGPMHWAQLPDLEVEVIDSATVASATSAPSGWGAKLKKFFGG